MSQQPVKPSKIGTEITVRISLTFQEAPDVHTLLAMTPVRDRGKLVRLALERFVAETGHPAGDVEHQIHMIASWLRSRTAPTQTTVGDSNQLRTTRNTKLGWPMQVHDTSVLPVGSTNVAADAVGRSDSVQEEPETSSSSIKRWLQS